MNQEERLQFINETLETLFPDVHPSLDFTSTYTLLVATLLSAQCTDERVNKVTPKLFAVASTPEQMALVPEETIESLIFSCGLAPKKARAIRELSRILSEKHDGDVPATFEDLEALPGVGHKTASVVLSQGFGIPAFPVDTHIFRLAHRWGLSKGKSVEKVEADLKKLFPKERWNKLHLQMIFFARAYCPAKKHDKSRCPICSRI